MSATEIGDITAYLRWVANIENHDWPPQDSTTRWKRATEKMLATATLSPGAALIQQENCQLCHELGGQGESKGQRLEWIGARRNATWIADYLADPQKLAPGSVMPDYSRLSQGQRETIGEFITALAAARGGNR